MVNTLLSPIGIFGGTFDPIHFGHLRLAQELAVGLGFGQVRFIPAGHPPHRAKPRTPALHRLEMVRLAIAGNPLFVLDDREVLKETASYTVETLQDLRSELGSDVPLCLNMGADAFLALTTWHQWRSLFDLAHIVVAHRPGFPQATWADGMPHALQEQLNLRLNHDPKSLNSSPAGAIMTHVITPLDISASHIRMELQAGISPRYLLPDVVLDYIHTNHLYADVYGT